MTVCGTVTVNALASVPPVPLGFVTVTSRAPPVASAAIVNVAVSLVDDTNATLPTVMPVPALTVAPFTNVVPSIVTGTAVPDVPWLGVTALTVGAVLITFVDACTEVPSASVATIVSVPPVAKPSPPP